jgi:hypothetical protein
MSKFSGQRKVVDQFFAGRHGRRAHTRNPRIFRVRGTLLALGLFLLLGLLSGCESDDCVNCIELPAPVVPTGVHSISGDNLVIVQWYDLSYEPYDGQYNPNVVAYYIYSRYYTPGDENIGDREFSYIGEVAWDENYLSSGLHYFYDDLAVNGEEYEYAVTAVNEAGRESALSFEFVIDAPLPMNLDPTEIFDVNQNPSLAGWDFSRLDNGRVDPTAPGSTADIRMVFQGGVPYVQTNHEGVEIQDFGVFLDSENYLIFEGVSYAPSGGYSSTGTIELIVGHIYVLRIYDPIAGTHYAKFGVTSITDDPEDLVDSVGIIWAYQTIAGLPELSVPEKPATHDLKPMTISF